jgi:hypothetical protein
MEDGLMRWKDLRVALPLAVAIASSGCGGHLGGAAPLSEMPNDVRAANVHTNESMTVRIVDARSVPNAKLVIIHDNLGTNPTGPYWGGTQTVISGGGGSSEIPSTQIASAFTPSKNSTATVVKIALVAPSLPGFASSGFTLQVNDDDKGVPGKTLISAQLPATLPPSIPLCCALIVGTDSNGLALKAGKQYWVVVSGQNAQSDDAAGWNEKLTNQLHPSLAAVYCSYTASCPNGQGWYTFSGDEFGSGLAFAVLGKDN